MLFGENVVLVHIGFNKKHNLQNLTLGNYHPISIKIIHTIDAPPSRTQTCQTIGPISVFKPPNFVVY